MSLIQFKTIDLLLLCVIVGSCKSCLFTLEAFDICFSCLALLFTSSFEGRGEKVGCCWWWTRPPSGNERIPSSERNDSGVCRVVESITFGRLVSAASAEVCASATASASPTSRLQLIRYPLLPNESSSKNNEAYYFVRVDDVSKFPPSWHCIREFSSSRGHYTTTTNRISFPAACMIQRNEERLFDLV